MRAICVDDERLLLERTVSLCRELTPAKSFGLRRTARPRFAAVR